MSQTESGVAEQMVGMSIGALESLARLLGSGAKNLAVFLFTVARNTKPYRGITSVKSLLDGGHELKTLELDKKELHEFCVHAKKNDFPCTIINDKRLYQDKVPVLIRAVDAARANRVVELMRLNQPAQERETAREAPNPTTGRTNSPSLTRSRSRPSARRFSGRENIGNISPSETRPGELRPSVRKKILSIQRERRVERTQAARENGAPVQAQPIPQPHIWNAQDERMMEAVRQFIATLTAITQEVMVQPQTATLPAQGERTNNREREQPIRAMPAAQPRQSVRASVAQARQRHEAGTSSRSPAPTFKRVVPTKGGR